MLAAYIEREVPETSVKLLDMKVSPLRPEDIGPAIAKERPDIVGLSAMSPYAELLHQIAKSIRTALPDVLLLTGGPHGTSFPSTVLKDHHIDAVVLGEGELVLSNVIKAYKEGSPIEGIAGVGTRSRLDPDERDIVHNLDTLPFPAWHKIDTSTYKGYTTLGPIGRRRYMPILTSRGCPYHCIYCHNIFGKKFRARSSENILEEIRMLITDYGIYDIEVIDDVFNLNRERVRAICEGIINEKLKVRLYFPNGLRSDILDDDLLKLMRRAGTVHICFAIETASPRLQKFIHKNLDLERAICAIHTASRLGIFSAAYFMLGFPTETEEELRSTLEFALNSPLQFAHFLNVIPFKGTPLYSMLDSDTKECFNSHHSSFKFDNFNFNLSDIPNQRFRSIIRNAFLRFYLNPFRIFSIIRHHPNKIGLFQLARYAFLRILLRSN